MVIGLIGTTSGVWLRSQAGPKAAMDEGANTRNSFCLATLNVSRLLRFAYLHHIFNSSDVEVNRQFDILLPSCTENTR